jgi:hypothetical protein
MKLTPEQRRVFSLIITREYPRFQQRKWPLDHTIVNALFLGFTPSGKDRHQPARDATLRLLIEKGLLKEVKPASIEDGINRYVQITNEGWEHWDSFN